MNSTKCVVTSARGGADVAGEGVQIGLLTLLDGVRTHLRPPHGGSSGWSGIIDTSRILFVCGGAFVGLEEAARQALALGTGARALRWIIERSLDDVDYRPVELAEQGVHRILIDGAPRDAPPTGNRSAHRRSPPIPPGPPLPCRRSVNVRRTPWLQGDLAQW